MRQPFARAFLQFILRYVDVKSGIMELLLMCVTLSLTFSGTNAGSVSLQAVPEIVNEELLYCDDGYAKEESGSSERGEGSDAVEEPADRMAAASRRECAITCSVVHEGPLPVSPLITVNGTDLSSADIRHKGHLPGFNVTTDVTGLRYTLTFICAPLQYRCFLNGGDSSPTVQVRPAGVEQCISASPTSDPQSSTVESTSTMREASSSVYSSVQVKETGAIPKRPIPPLLHVHFLGLVVGAPVAALISISAVLAGIAALAVACLAPPLRLWRSLSRRYRQQQSASNADTHAALSEQETGTGKEAFYIVNDKKLLHLIPMEVASGVMAGGHESEVTSRDRIQSGSSSISSCSTVEPVSATDNQVKHVPDLTAQDDEHA